ncbi:MAG: OsmC family protein [Gemmatimonadetes bacterium]|nr:OsmC family protein [Gemmatimonadota bacterium]MBT8402363.1 OsmC family protein [Gemmatimonadota bacterium]NNF39350.1 OsmC family protein [Gemmatimonadota bacterium]NNK64391.1 OsmC family protein [Gemmatimonadota bacterium]
MADKHVKVRWTGEGDRFAGGHVGGPATAVDGAGSAAPSPMDMVLVGLASCMGIDIVMILQKGRVPVEDLDIEIEADRATDPPRRFTSVSMTVRVVGPSEEQRSKVERAVALSRDTYCSVFHSLREDLDVRIHIDLG